MTHDIETQIKEMEEMKLPDLQQRFAEVVGEETKAPNKKFLIKRIVEVLEREGAEQNEISEDEQDVAPEEDAKDTGDIVFNDEDNDSGDIPETDNNTITTVVAEDITEDCITEDTTRLSQLDVDALRERYNQIVGRPTGSRDKRYLVWKIRQAQQGKVPMGPIPGRQTDGIRRDCKVIPVRLEAELVERLDEAWKRMGMKSRMELFRLALSLYFEKKGESVLASRLTCQINEIVPLRVK